MSVRERDRLAVNNGRLQAAPAFATYTSTLPGTLSPFVTAATVGRAAAGIFAAVQARNAAGIFRAFGWPLGSRVSVMPRLTRAGFNVVGGVEVAFELEHPATSPPITIAAAAISHAVVEPMPMRRPAISCSLVR